MGSAPKSSRLQLVEQTEDLKKVVGMGKRRFTFEEWAQTLPQAARDQFAARAILANMGNVYDAALQLGFPLPQRGHKDDYYRDVIEPVFKTPGVQEILDRELKKPDEWREKLISRQVEIALYGSDKEATTAFTQLSRTCGWQKTPDIFVQNNRATILALVARNVPGAPAQPDEPAIPQFLEHEPGAPVRIDSDSELIDAVLGEQV